MPALTVWKVLSKGIRSVTRSAATPVIVWSAEIDILIFDLCGPARSEQIFDAAAGNPSSFDLIRVQDVKAVIEVNRGIDIRIGKAAGCVDQSATKGIAEATADGPEKVDVLARMEKCRCEAA